MRAHSVPEHYGVATNRYKLIHYPETQEWELFDRKVDPNEIRSLYDSSDYLVIQEELEREMEDLRKQLGLVESAPGASRR